jgi:hypothetical protein
MTIPMVSYEGRMSYCLVKCLQMVLAHQGQSYPLPWLECVSGEVFGFVYIRDGQRFFAVVGYEYHQAGEHLLRALNYDYSFTGAADDTTALAALDDALRMGPVVAGMLDMGYLSYIPNHQMIRGVDHAVVVLARQPNGVVVHDPEGYPIMPLPLADFLAAWQRDIYTGTPYGLWRIGAQSTPPTEDAIWEQTLAHARELYARQTETIPGGSMVLFGPEALRTLAADLRDAPPERGLDGLPYFSWRVSAQRCMDGAFFLRERLPEAAAIRWEQAQLYGTLQQASSVHESARLPDLLERQADHETRFIAALG